MQLRELRVAVLLQRQHSPEIRGKRLPRPVVKLCHAVGVDLPDRRVHVRLRKAVRLRLRHLVCRGAGIVHLTHPLDDPVQNFLLAGIVLIERGLRDAERSRDVAH